MGRSLARGSAEKLSSYSSLKVFRGGYIFALIIIVRSKERAAKTIYFTGCTHFNREIKQRAENMGMYLDDNGLYNVQVIRDRDGRKVTEADLEERCVALVNEKAVFDILNMKFIEPHDRKVCRCSSAVLGSTFTSAAPST